MIFIHGHTFVEKDGQIYTSGSLNKKLFKRYIHWFGDVTVFATKRRANKDDGKIINELNKVDNVEFQLVEKRNNIYTFIKNRKFIKQLVSKQDYLVVRLPSVYGMIGIRYAHILGKPYIVELVGCPWDSLWNHSWKGKIIAPFMWITTKLSLRSAPYALYVTNDYLQNKYACSGNTIGCSDVALPTFDKNILEKRLIKIKSDEKNKPIVIGTIGAVNVRYKGQEYVIRAISKLNKNGYNIKYGIVGSGDNTYLKSVAKKYGVTDSVKFIGSLSHAKVFEFLDEIDIYIQPSLTEGMPRALIEAMSRGCPAIGSDVGGIPELISQQYVFKHKDVNSLIKKIKQMTSDKMTNEAIRNYEKAKQFEKTILDKKRNNFYMEFKNYYKDQSI